eukprot:TRINITY_DN2344_c0_g1_i3.p1 TRINITY_DN2344_c0_g1~~TRINITY_DN2344_c0_g1_i3.p1  ORF type:complete len:247 (-),score=34.07 TRINITY_DN2344_c0_g1_i3:75-788(-)
MAAGWIPILNTTRVSQKALRCLVGLVIWTLASAAMIFASKYAEFYHATGDNLPDSVLSNAPHLKDDGPLMVQTLLAVCILSDVLRMLTHRDGLVIFRRVLIVLSFLYTGRALTLLGTQYPDPQLRCQHFQWWDSWNISHIILADTCGDMMYSGHAIHMITMSLCVHRYTENFAVKWLYVLLPVIGSVLLLLAHMHYTDDVIVAWLLSVGAWRMYHFHALPSHRNDAVAPFRLRVSRR